MKRKNEVDMEFLLVGDSKLKIVMSDTEVAAHGLSSAASAVDSPTTRRSFWRVLKLAEGEVGFNPTDDKVLVQFYPMKNGGGELFVTKLGLLSDSSARTVARSDRVAILSHRCGYYRFDSLGDLISATAALRATVRDTPPLTDVYIDQHCRYYLSVDEYGKGGEPSEYPVLTEYAKWLTADLSAYIAEHCLRLSDGDGIALFAE